MKGMSPSCRAAIVSAAVALLAGCGGPQSLIGAPGAMPQGRAIVTHADRSGSWMLPEAKNASLLYTAGGCGGACVIAYPSGKVVGSIDVTTVNQACANESGDVFFTTYLGSLESEILEYAHGGTKPIATLTIPRQAIAGGCAVDPTTGNLAVTYLCPDCGGSGVAVFPHSTGTPTIYQSDFNLLFCAYDSNGNLFVDGWFASYAEDVLFAELAKGSSTFSGISTPSSLWATGYPWQMQWDGKYMTYEAVGSPQNAWGVTIYRLEFSGSTATVVGQTNFKGVTRSAAQSWIHGNRVFIPYGVRGDGIVKSRIGVWKYPQGGDSIEIFKSFPGNKPSFQGIAFSKESNR